MLLMRDQQWHRYEINNFVKYGRLKSWCWRKFIISNKSLTHFLSRWQRHRRRCLRERFLWHCMFCDTREVWARYIQGKSYTHTQLYMQKLINTQVLRLWNWILITNLPRMCTKPSSLRNSLGRQWKSVKKHADDIHIIYIAQKLFTN